MHIMWHIGLLKVNLFGLEFSPLKHPILNWCPSVARCRPTLKPTIHLAFVVCPWPFWVVVGSFRLIMPASANHHKLLCWRHKTFYPSATPKTAFENTRQQYFFFKMWPAYLDSSTCLNLSIWDIGFFFKLKSILKAYFSSYFNRYAEKAWTALASWSHGWPRTPY